MPKCSELEAFHPKTVIICGNGAVGWLPADATDPKGNDVWKLIQEAVNDFKTTALGYGVGIPALASNCVNWLANVERIITYYNTEKPGSMPEEMQLATQKLREKIAYWLGKEKIILRTLECFGCTCGDTLGVEQLAACGVITLNWEMPIQDLPHTVHLHGRINRPECLVFPTQDFIKLQPSGGKMNQGFGAFPTAHKWLDECSNLIIWGCRFNDYDSILLSVVTLATLSKQKDLNIFVCNPSKVDLEKKLKDYFPLATFFNCLNKFKTFI